MSGLALGRVLAAGTDVSNAKVGDRVLLPLYSHTWRERVVVPSNGLVFLPPEADVQQLAMLRINPPAAALMLGEYVDLHPGDWVIQNRRQLRRGSCRAVIAFGKARGYRIIKSRPPDRAVAEVEAAGGEVVLVDDDAAPDRIAEIVSDGSIRLALDGVPRGNGQAGEDPVATRGARRLYGRLLCSGRAPRSHGQGFYPSQLLSGPTGL